MDWQSAVQLALRERDFTQLETHSFRNGWAVKKRLAGSYGEISNPVAFGLPDMPLVFIRRSATVLFSIWTGFYPKCLSRSDASRVNWKMDCDEYIMGRMARETQPLRLASDGLFTFLFSLGAILCSLLNILRNVDIAYVETDFLLVLILGDARAHTQAHMFKALLSTLLFNIWVWQHSHVHLVHK